MTVYKAEPCGCRAKNCKDWHVSPVAAVHSVGFTKEQAELVAYVLNDQAKADGESFVPKIVEDAARWRNLVGAGRLRIMGSAGFGYKASTGERIGPSTIGFRHIGLEVWSTYTFPSNVPAEEVAIDETRMTREREEAIALLVELGEQVEKRAAR